MRRCSAFLLMMLPVCCFAQQFTTINYSVAQGFPSSEVYEVFEDSKGFLWFGTDNGVVRFDGFELEKFTIDKGLTDPVVFGFFEDKKGRIWFRTYSGRLCYYENGTLHQYPFNDKLVTILPLGEINFVYDSDLEELHFTIVAVMGKIDSTGIVSFNQVNEPGIYLEKAGEYLISREAAHISGLVKRVTIDNKSFPIDDTNTAMVHRQTRVLRFNGKIYFTIKNRLYVYSEGALALALEGRSNIISVSKDLSDNIWIGYLFDGVQRFSNEEFTNPWEPQFFKNKSVTRVLEDEEHGLWISTLEDGVYHIPNPDIVNISFETKAKIRNAIPFRNSFLVGDEAGYLYEFDHTTHKLKEIRNLGSSILAQFVDSRSRIWISSVTTIYAFDSLLNNAVVTPKLSCSDFFEDDHNVVWGYGNHSIKSFDSQAKLRTKNYFNVRYRQIFVNDSAILLSGRIGLTVRDRSYNLKDSPPFFVNVKITDMLSLNDSSVLITTLGSGYIVLNLRRGTCRQFNARKNFIADNVYHVVKSGNAIWMATEKGVAATTLDQLLTAHPDFQYVTQKSGLLSNKINFLIVKANEVLAFSDDGVSTIPLPIKRFGNAEPRFYLKNVEINQRSRPLGDLTHLSHEENNIVIKFGYQSFNNPHIFTRYKLAAEDIWNYSNNNEVQFNALAPGSYELMLEYSVDNVHWARARGIPTIVITSPWWQTWYFKVLMGIVTGAFVFLYIRYQVNIARKQQLKMIQLELEAIEQERKRIAKDLHDSVGTDFSAIKMMVSQVLKKHNEPKSEEIETQFQSTIQDIKAIIYGLSPPGIERYGLMAALKNYVDKLNGSIPVVIELNTFGPELKDTKITLAIFRIIQELVSNTLKHANATNIRLHVSHFEDLINIVYEDNGKGFRWTGESKGLGLYNIESRLQTLGGSLRFDSGEFGISCTIDIPTQVHSA